MMSSKPASNCRDLVTHGKMPRLQRSVGDPVLPGFPSSPSLPRYAHEEPTNYSGAYYSMCLSGQERGDLSAHCNPSRTFMQSGRNPIFFPSSANRALPNHLLHRTKHMALPVEKSPPMEQKELAAKQKMAFYDRSPGKLSPDVPRVHTPVAARETNVEGTNVSPQTETSVGLAIPKPIYARNVCCAELGCSSGPSYSTERGDARVHHPFCDKEWMLQYGPLSILQRKDQEALMQQKVLELEHSRRQSLKEAQLDGYLAMRPAGLTRMPAFAEQNYGRFPYADSAHSMLGPPGQPYHRLPSKMYHSLPSSIPYTYEEMQLSALSHSGVSSKLYRDHTTAPSHPQCPPHPAFYYPQGGTKVASSVQYSDRGGSNRQDPLGSISKQHTQNPSGPYRVPHSVFSDIPAPCPITQQNHSFLQHYEIPPYQLYKTHTSPGQKRPFSDGPGSTVSFAEQLEHCSSLKAQLMSPSRALCGQGFGSSAFHPVLPRFDHGSDSQESVVVLDGGLTSAQVASPHSVVSQRRGERAVTDLTNGDSGPRPSCVRVYTNEQSSKTNSTVSSESHTLNQKEDNGLFVEIPRKPDEDDRKLVDAPSSPPMPVINNVFSLAPYKAYLEATGMLSAPNVPDHGDPELGTSRLQPDIQINERDAQQASMPKDVLISFGNSWPSQEEAVNIREPKKIKTEPDEEEVTHNSFKTDQSSYQGVHCGLQEICKEEPDVLTSTSSPDDVLDLRVKKSDSHESSCKLQMLTGGSEHMGSSSEDPGTAGACEVNSANENPELMQTSPKPSTPRFSPSDKKLRFQHIPPEYLKLSAYKIVVPDTLRAPCNNTTDLPSDPKGLEDTKPLLKPKPHSDSSRRPRHHFMELHQSLCRLISRSVSHTPELDLRAWFDNKDRGLSAPSHIKTQRVSCLLGVEVRDLWLKCNDTAAVFHQLIRHMESFVSNCRCPFPHVVRAGMLFIPMLIVKESLFPQVPGAFIDQVLQERRVELRPTTLSEERHLAQLQKRACSSKLRRLLSLKHLPEVYPDVLNLFYHVCVSRRLGTELRDSMKKEPSRGKDTDMSCRSHVRTGCRTPGFSEKLNNSASLKKQKRNGRRMSDSKRLFSGGNMLKKQHNAEPSGKFENWSIVSSFCENGDGTQSTCEGGMESIQIKVEGDSSDLEQAAEEKPDKAWGPVMSDEVSSGDSDTENDRTSTMSEHSQSSDSTKPSASSRGRSGMILKLRKVLFDQGSGKYDSGFQPICDTGNCGQSGINARKIMGEQGRHQERSQRIRAGEVRGEKGILSGATGYTCSSSKAIQLHRSKKSLCMSRPLVQVKYCSYLSSGHKQHRRWVLRSAVRTARRAMKNQTHYPELVGKRICHLYEEKDKSEVWYKGVVVRVHEPHPNPLKTVFEVKYDSEPEWQYYLELLLDYKKGWLKLED